MRDDGYIETRFLFDARRMKRKLKSKNQVEISNPEKCLLDEGIALPFVSPNQTQILRKDRCRDPTLSPQQIQVSKLSAANKSFYNNALKKEYPAMIEWYTT